MQKASTRFSRFPYLSPFCLIIQYSIKAEKKQGESVYIESTKLQNRPWFVYFDEKAIQNQPYF
jgi:hypothetical protein